MLPLGNKKSFLGCISPTFKGFVLNRCCKGQVRRCSNSGNPLTFTFGCQSPQRLIEPPDVSVLNRAGGAAGPDGQEGTPGTLPLR